jgi:pyruvate carboxylase subunit B
LVKLTDTIFRDAHQSLIATRLRSRDMLPVTERLDQVGFFSLEVWGGATFDACIRYLNEDPWERLRNLKKAMPNTPMQMLLRGQNLVGYRNYPDDIVEKFVITAAKNGVDIFRVFDALNDVRNMELAIKVAKKEGAHVQGCICYTTSPVHTIDGFVRTFEELASLGCDSLCIKDMAGIITPTMAEELVRKTKRSINLPLDLHSHCTAGLAPTSYFKAAEAGCDILDTALSPFGGGTSQPATEAIVAMLKGTPYDTGLDIQLLHEIAQDLLKLRDKYGHILDPISLRVDANVLRYQIPGGMMSNLVSQLKEQNALERFNDVLAETPRVRKELGYPPLVTPTSQIVGTQAVLNVVLGERYKMVPKEVRDYVKGLYGRTPAPVDPEIQRKVIGDEEPIKVRPGDLIEPEWEMRKAEAEKLGITISDENVITYALYPAVAPRFLKGEASEEALTPPKGEGAPAGAFMDIVGARQYRISMGGKTFDVMVEELEKKRPGPGTTRTVKVLRSGGTKRATAPDEPVGEGAKKKMPVATTIVERVRDGEGDKAATRPQGTVISPMQGLILKVLVKPGDEVKAGGVVAILEAMKMENEITTNIEGKVREVFVEPGQIVQGGSKICLIR